MKRLVEYFCATLIIFLLAGAAMGQDDKGFTNIFDGKSMAGWNGDKSLWRIENGAIVGETTAERRFGPTTLSSGIMKLTISF